MPTENSVPAMTGERRLVNAHTAPQTIAELEAFDRLTAVPYISHVGSRSFLVERRGPGVTENGTPFLDETVVVEQVYGLPTHHPPGVCFDCSLIPSPPGWSAAERLAREEEPAISGLRGKILNGGHESAVQP